MVVGSYTPYLFNLIPCDFFLFSRMNRDLKGRCLLTLQRFNENAWLPFTSFPLKILDKTFSKGSSAGITASSHRGSTLKGAKVSNL
jgi:hypothetical protein